MNNLKNILNKIPFEYIFLTFAIISAILVERSSFIYSPLIMIIICIFAAWKINAVKFSVCIIGTLLLMLCSFIRSSTPPGSLKEKLNDHPIHGKIVFEITDPLCCSLPDIKNGATTEIKIHSITTLAGEKYCGSGKFLIYSENLLPAQSMYGDILEIEGTLRFRTPDSAWDSPSGQDISDFRFGNFNRYLKVNNIDGIISPEKERTAAKISFRNSIFRTMLTLRDRTLKYVTENIKDNNNKNLTAALFFGLKGALDKESKQQFIKSGTIHLFSVSGLHVGILFAILLPILAFLPVRIRYLAGSLLLIPFLLTTGSNIPALRAFLMILTFAILRFFCFQTPMLRIPAFWCAVFLICDTANLTDAGFLYSFGITAILIRCADLFSEWNRIWNTDNTLKASNRKNPARKSYHQKYIRKIIFAICCSTAAFAGGSIITLYSFGYLYFSAVWINFFILFYCPCLTVVFIVNIVLGAFGTVGIYGGACFEKMLDLMHEIIQFGAEFPMQISTVQISYFQALLFYLALLLVLCVRNKKVFTCSMVFLIMFLPANTLLNDQQKAELLLIRNPSDKQCAFVLADPAGDYAVCFNAADAKSMELARKFIASKGINHFNLYVMQGVGKNQLNALAAAVSNLDIGKVIHISRRKLPDDFKLPPDTIYEHIIISSVQWEISQNSCRFFRKKAQFGFEYFNTEAIIPLCIIFDSENQTVAVGENTENKTVWKNSNLLEYSVYGL